MVILTHEFKDSLKSVLMNRGDSLDKR